MMKRMAPWEWLDGRTDEERMDPGQEGEYETLQDLPTRLEKRRRNVRNHDSADDRN